MRHFQRFSVLIPVGLLALIGGGFGPSLNAVEVVHVTDIMSGQIVGTSQLLRTEEGIAFKLDTTGLIPGGGYTMWVLIDENDNTAGGPPAVQPFEIRLQIGGEFAASDGSGQFSSFLRAGPIPPHLGQNEVTAADDGFFDDPEEANILLVVRAHGTAISGLEYEQTHFFDGGGVPSMSVQHAMHFRDRRD